MYETKNIGHADAQRAIAVVVAELQRRGKGAAVAVSDAHGELLAFMRTDGAPLPTITNAMNKAFTAARERKPSWEVGKSSRDPKGGFDIAYLGDRRYIGWGGGVPVVAGNATVGGIGVSGLTEQEDEDLARMGAQAIVNG